MARNRLFRFYITVDDTAVSGSIRNLFFPDVTDYFFGYTVAGAADGGPVHMIEDGWESVPYDGIMDFPLSTVERSHFYVGAAVIPNSKVDPKDPASEPLIRTLGMHTDDFVPLKTADAPELAKKFPDGVFILQIDLVAFYVPFMVPGLTTFEAELSQAGIRPQDIVYHAMNPIRDAAGKALYAQHHVVYWSDDLHLSGRKYVP